MPSNYKREQVIFSIALLISFATVIYIDISANATYDSGDGMLHFLISHYSWKHPALFLHHWGKPFFTLISSPFAQFGMNGMILFQAVCASAVSFFCYKIAKKLNLSYAWLIPLFIFFSPIYFAVINTGLTEIFFGCMLMLSIWLIFEKNYILAAVATSLLPFVRVEAFVTLPLIVIVLFTRKQFLALPFLLTGIIIYSVIGYFYYHDYLWVFHQNQNFFNEGYTGGKGEFFYYVNNYESILGTSLSVLFVAGLLGPLYSVFAIRNSTSSFLLEEIILIYGSVFACLLLNTLSYWMPGVLTNLGMMRYMTTLIPPLSLIALRGLNTILFPLKRFFFLPPIVIVIITFFIIQSPFKQNYFPFQLQNEEKVIRAAAKWFKKSEEKKNKVYYSTHFLISEIERDPFDKKCSEELSHVDKNGFANNIEENAIIIWDASHGPNESGIKLDLLINNPHFELLHMFVPAHEFFVLGKNKFEVYIFQKRNPLKPDSIRSKPDTLDFDLLDFEYSDGLMQPELLSSENSYSGKQSSKSTDSTEFGPGIQKPISEINHWESLKEITIRLELFTPVVPKDLFCSMETVDANNKQFEWQSKQIKLNSGDLSKWVPFSCSFVINPDFLLKENFLKIYVWNQGRNNFYADDLKIFYKKNDSKKTIVW